MSWGYAINQWKHGPSHFVRVEEHVRAFKTVAATGFEEIELRAGTFRWEPLGRPDRIEQYYGSVEAFAEVLRSCGVSRVVSVFYDPGEMILEELSFGRDPARPEHRGAIVDSLRPFADLLRQLGGSTLVVRPADSYWRTGKLSSEQLDEVAATWNAAGAMAQEHGVGVALHVDALSALQTAEEIGELLERSDPGVGLALDTAELTLAGIDPVALYEQHAERIAHIHLKDVRTADSLGERTQELAEQRFLSAGGERRIDRWFWELGTSGGLVDFPALFAALSRERYTGALVVESDQSPDPAGSAMLNGWYMRRHARAFRGARPAGSWPT